MSDRKDHADLPAENTELRRRRFLKAASAVGPAAVVLTSKSAWAASSCAQTLEAARSGGESIWVNSPHHNSGRRDLFTNNYDSQPGQGGSYSRYVQWLRHGSVDEVCYSN